MTQERVLTNPFDNEEGLFQVLRNDVGEFSLWPAPLTVPVGWDIALDTVPANEAEAWVREQWTSLTPAHRVRRQVIGANG